MSSCPRAPSHSLRPPSFLHACLIARRFEKAERELARAMAIGRSLQTRREVLEAAEQLCGEMVNMIKVSASLCAAPRALVTCHPSQVKALDVEGSKQALADARAKGSALQRRLDAEQASLNELGQRIEQLLRREDNLSCIEARARRHDAEAGCAAAAVAVTCFT